MGQVSNSIMIGTGGGGTTITVVANYSALPDPTTVSGQFYWAEASQGTSWLPGSLGGTYYNSGMYYSNGVSWTFMNVPYQATQAEVNTGTNTDKFVTPETLKNQNYLATIAYADAKVEDAIVNGVTDKAPSQNAVFDLAELKANKDSTFPMRFQFATSNPLDSTTYYVGGSNNLVLSTTNNRFVYAGITATTFRVSIFLYNTGTLGTSENATITLLNITQGTNIILTTTAKFNSTSYGFVGNFTFAITEGDSLALSIVTPNYATNPTSVLGGVNLILKQ